MGIEYRVLLGSDKIRRNTSSSPRNAEIKLNPFELWSPLLLVGLISHHLKLN